MLIYIVATIGTLLCIGIVWRTLRPKTIEEQCAHRKKLALRLQLAEKACFIANTGFQSPEIEIRYTIRDYLGDWWDGSVDVQLADTEEPVFSARIERLADRHIPAPCSRHLHTGVYRAKEITLYRQGWEDKLDAVFRSAQQAYKIKQQAEADADASQDRARFGL